MLFTKETDYGIRMIRALHDGKRHKISEICETENIPQAFAYKVVKKLDNAGIVSCYRGINGGCSLNVSPMEITLYDVVMAIEPDFAVMACIYNSCENNTDDKHCKVHYELERIQAAVKDLLTQKSLYQILME